MVELCLGTAQLGMKYGIANSSKIPDQKHVNRIISQSLLSGIRYFDTAQTYGESELVLGNAFAQSSHSLDVRVVSKYFPSSNALSIDDLKASVKKP